jgi:aspartyl-tRNA(Asn)/glutamyl-tRNA(Gln) amidotransferase subunit B
MRIGLEIHVQLPTRSKLFCGCSTSGDAPNSSVCPVCLGFPGSRPFLNRRALEMGVLIAKFLNCKMSDRVWFARKTYFYPDLPKNFQITQYDSPLGVDGHFMIGEKRVGIWRVLIEEDPGRIRRVGRSGEEVALIDYDRSGIPLVEIVTAPDMTSPAEARDFLTDLIIELRRLINVTGEEQTMRVDANVSVVRRGWRSRISPASRTWRKD